ncbi:MAG: universal stress protein [Saprospiraceae bacterium]|nr:universal stress protein [Saprospiraceae bacterium]
MSLSMHQPKYEYIIMGSHGASNLFESLLGSVSHRVASESQCPVILVPPGVEFYKLSEICILGKGKESDITAEVMKAFPNIKVSHYETNGLAVAVGGYDTHPWMKLIFPSKKRTLILSPAWIVTNTPGPLVITLL